jgi:hypothetical protein
LCYQEIVALTIQGFIQVQKRNLDLSSVDRGDLCLQIVVFEVLLVLRCRA